MKLKITTLIIIEGNQVENIYHSLEDNQDKAYQDLINQIPITTQTQVQPSTSTYVPKTN